MKAVEFNDQNMVFNKPEDMTDEQCEPLHAKAYDLFVGPKEDDVYPAIDSVWELDAEDIKLINLTGKIRLTIFGRGMPPISLRVEDIEPGEAIIEFNNGKNITISEEPTGKIISLPKPKIILP